MEKFTICLIFVLSNIVAYAQSGNLQLNDSIAETEIKKQYNIERQLILNQDTVGMNKFYPDDFVVTNPFNQFINKSTVLSRVKLNVIKYNSYERNFDSFRFYGNTAIVIGSEIVIPTQDAARADAGKTVNRRFTEVWIKRNMKWEKIVRHANNIL